MGLYLYDTTPFSIVDFRLIWRGEIVHFNVSQSLMGLYSCVCLMANRLGQVDRLKIGATAWHQKEHVTFSDMLRAVRMVIWRDNLISRKGKIAPSMENINPEMERWMENVVECMLQAA